jgi:hypothetical protein
MIEYISLGLIALAALFVSNRKTETVSQAPHGDVGVASVNHNPTGGSTARGLLINNPGNIRAGTDKWLGMVGVADGFVHFSSPSYGVRALARIIRTKYARGLDSIRAIISSYAPPSENDTDNYVRFMSDWVGVNPDAPLDLNDDTMYKLVSGIIRMEVGHSYEEYEVRQWMNLA